MSYSEEIKAKSLEVFKSVPWSNAPKAVANTAPSASNEGSEDTNSSEFVDQTVTAFRDNVNWLGDNSSAAVAASNTSSPATNEFNDSGSGNSDPDNNSLDSSDELFSGARDDDDFGIDSFDDIDEPYSDFIPSEPARFSPDRQEAPKLVIRSNTRSDSSSSDFTGNVETDLQRIAIVMLSKKNTLAFTKAIAAIAVLLVGIGLWSDYSKLGVAKASSNPNELRSYLSSQFTYIWDTDIRLRLSDIETSAYEQAKATGSIGDYKRYLRDFPNGRYFNEVLDSIGPINQSGEVQ